MRWSFKGAQNYEAFIIQRAAGDNSWVEIGRIPIEQARVKGETDKFEWGFSELAGNYHFRIIAAGSSYPHTDYNIDLFTKEKFKSEFYDDARKRYLNNITSEDTSTPPSPYMGGTGRHGSKWVFLKSDGE